MNKVMIYQYPACSTCRKALKWLKDHQIDAESIDITKTPPTVDELKELISKSGIPIKKFFNTSGVVYKENNLKDKLQNMNEEEQLQLLASTGKLIKRPIITNGNKVTVGFKEQDIENVWG